LKPQIEKTFSINVLHQTLFGHSLGGLFALYTLFIKATAFQYYIAISPSIWWDNRYILTRVEPFMTNLHKQKNRLNLFLA
ncbi:alpha/beta hydrolase, partial [Escherichia coli]